MALIDDLVSSGLTLPQAQAVIAEDSGDSTDAMIAAGFWGTQASAMAAYDTSPTTENLDAVVQQGIWAGPTITAIKAALDVTP